MARILVIDDDINLLQMVKLMLERVGHTVEISNRGEKGIQLAADNRPDLAIIDVMMPGLNGYDVVRRLRQDARTTDIPIIVLTARSQTMDKNTALKAGANAFISKPVTSQDLTARVDAVLRAGVNYRVHTGLLTEPVSEPPEANPPGGQAPPERSRGQTPAPRPTPPPAPASRVPIGAEPPAQTAPQPNPEAATPVRLPIVAVVGLRGGTGTTTLAINLAFQLARRGRRVCLADFSTASGHIPLHLHLSPAHNWGELLAQGSKPEPRAVLKLLTQHPASGVQLLAAPPVPTAEVLPSKTTESILRDLGSAFNHVIVDIPLLNAATLTTLVAARAIVVVMADDPASIQTASQLLILLQRHAIDMNRVRIALNLVRSARDVPTETVEKGLKRPVTVEIPYDPDQPNAIRRGIPSVVADPEGPLTRGVQQLLRTMPV